MYKQVKKISSKRVLFSIGIILAVITLNIFVENVNCWQLIEKVSASEQVLKNFNKVETSDTPEMDPKFGYRYGPYYGTEALNEWFIAVLVPAARDADANLQEADYRIQTLRLFPFDSGNNEARRTYLLHTKAWSVYLRDIAKCSDYDCRVNAYQASGSDITPTFKVAKIAAENSLPLLDLFNSMAKISAIYAD